MTKPQMICIVLMLVGSSMITHQITCPSDEKEWVIRAEKFNCSKKSGKTYHCISLQTAISSNMFTEVCMVKALLSPDKGGCPWISFRDGEPIIGDPPLPCSGYFCPAKHQESYYTDELYKYPGCINKCENKIPCMLNLTDFKSGTETVCVGEEVTPWKFAVGILAFVLIGVMCTSLLIYGRRTLVSRFCRKKRAKDSCASEGLLEMDVTPDECHVTVEREETSEDDTGGHDDDDDDNDDGDDDDDVEQFYTFPANSISRCKGYVPLNVRNKLKNILQNGNRVLLTGIQGAGKTAAAEWYGSFQRCINSESLTWKVPAKNLDSIYRHLMKFCRHLKLASTLREKARIEDILELLKEVKEKLDPNVTHVLIFEYVVKDTQEAMQSIIEFIDSLKGVKCIVIVHDLRIFKQTKLFHRCNSISDFHFSKADVLDLFDKDARGNEEILTKMASHLFSYPFVFKCARFYMLSKKISVEKMFELLNESVRSAAAKTNVVEWMLDMAKKQEGEMYEILQHFQYFEKTNIPLFVLRYIKVQTSADAEESQLCKFVEFIERFSFGHIREMDGEKILDLSSVLHSTLSRENDEQSQRGYVALKCFAQLMSKEHDQTISRNRCKSLLPHAKFALDNVERKSPIAESLCKIMVSERLYRIYKTIGQKENSRQQCIKSVQFCYELLEMDFETIVKGNRVEDEHFSASLDSTKDASRTMAEEILKTINYRLNGNTDTELTKFPNEYICMKLRHVHDQDIIKRGVPSAYSERCFLLQKELEELKKKTLAVDADNIQLVKLFIIETIITSFLSYGLEKEVSDGKENEVVLPDRLTHLCLACELGKLLENEFNEYPSLSAFYSKINGELELMMSLKYNGNESKDAKVSALKEVEQKIMAILDKDTEYFYNGVLARDKYDPNPKIYCIKQLLKCYQMLEDVSKDDEWRTRADEYADKMRTLLLGFKEGFSFRAYRSQEMKQYLAEYFIRREEYGRAAHLLETLEHVSYKTTTPDTFITPSDMKDWEMLSVCYLKLKSSEKLDTMCQCLKDLNQKIDPERLESIKQFMELCCAVNERKKSSVS